MDLAIQKNGISQETLAYYRITRTSPLEDAAATW
jgi:hypothetical protein